MTFKLPNRNLTIEELIRYRVQYIGVECRRCGHSGFVSIEYLRDRFGPRFKESQIRRALICNQCRRREFRARPIPWEQLPRTLQVALSLERKKREEREATNRELKSDSGRASPGVAGGNSR
jgi:hypothetical protein